MELQVRNFAVEMRGTDVQQLYYALCQVGYSISTEEQQQICSGTTTLGAVQVLQQEHGLEPSSVVDEQT